MLEFGVTVLPDPPYQRLIELTKLAEARGSPTAGRTTHVLWQESMPVMALLADQTSTIKLGHMVTNPAIRDYDGARERVPPPCRTSRTAA